MTVQGQVFVRIADERMEKEVQREMERRVKQRKIETGEKVTERILDTLFMEVFSSVSKGSQKLSVVTGSVFKPRKPNLTITTSKAHSILDDSLKPNPPSPKSGR